jgi:hypothetical protein
VNSRPASHSVVGSPTRAAPELSSSWSGVVPFTQERFFPLSVSKWFRAVLVCSFCTVFAACAGGQAVQQLSAEPPEAVSAQPAETAPLVYYAGVDQLAVYSEPQSSASPLTQLSLYQKVYRYKMEKGYAYIKVEESGITGWVDNARLIWRLPSQQQKAPAKTAEQAAESARAPVAEEKAPTPTTAAGAAEPEPTPTTAEVPTEQKPSSPASAPTSVPPVQSAPAAPTAPRPVGPSIFNPF